MSDEIIHKACEQQEEAIRLYLWEELEESRVVALEEHLVSCAGCRAEVESEQRLLALLAEAAPADPPRDLLAQCRIELSEKIEHAGLPGFWTRLGTVLWPRGWRWSFRGWMTAHPAFSAAVLVMAGVALGGALPQLLVSTSEGQADNGTAQSRVVASPAVAVPDMNVTGFELAESASGPQLVFRVSRETPEEWPMPLNDPRAQRWLVDVLQNGQRFTADTRLESVTLLQSLAEHEEVRETLCTVARSDRNPAIRLKALEALKGVRQDERVRQTILEALLKDENPGVRIEAVNALREMVESATAPDRELVRVLRERMANDPNTYIRLQSAAAVRSLEQRGVY